MAPTTPGVHPGVTWLLGRPQWEQRTKAWYDVRRTLLTASDVASALDIKPYESYRGSPRADLMRKKLENKPFSNMFTAHGQKYEDEARDLMVAALGEHVLDFGLLVHPEHPWLAASPDGVTTTGKCVEIKCPLRRVIVPGQVPHHYMPQVQVQMAVCNMSSTLFVQYRPAHLTTTGQCILDITVVERDPAWLDTQLPHLKRFYDEYMAALEVYVPLPPPTCTIVENLYDL